MKSLIIILVAFLLASCHMLQRQRSGQQAINSAFNHANAMCREVITDPALDPIRDRIPDVVSQATFDQLSNPAKVSESEAPLVRARADAFLKCQAQRRSAYQSVATAPPYITAHDMNTNRVVSLYASLVARELTYGQFVQQAQESWLVGQRALQEIDEAMRARNEREAMRRLQAYQIWQQSRPITCYRSGAYTTCQ
jgi:hypothetical protein